MELVWSLTPASIKPLPSWLWLLRLQHHMAYMEEFFWVSCLFGISGVFDVVRLSATDWSDASLWWRSTQSAFLCVTKSVCQLVCVLTCFPHLYSHVALTAGDVPPEHHCVCFTSHLSPRTVISHRMFPFLSAGSPHEILTTQNKRSHNGSVMF